VDSFEKAGFLSMTPSNGIDTIRAENADWFGLAEDLNRAFTKLAVTSTDTVKTSLWDPRSVAVRLLLRCCGNFQGVILLTERGMVVEGRTLVRSLTEGAFAVAALVNKPSEYIGLLKSDSEASRSRQANFVLAQKLIDDSQRQANLQAVIDAIGKVECVNLRRLAELGPLLRQYLSYQRLSDGAAHVSARALDRHVRRNQSHDGWCYQWGPGRRETNAATLYHAILAAVPVALGVTEVLNDTKGNAELAYIVNRLDTMAKPTEVI
jgi:Family of unknown function (DUF5677)